MPDVLKSKHLSRGGINHLTDGFCIINHLLKHLLNIRFKVMFETRHQRSVRDLGKSTEITEFFAEVKE